MSFVLLATQSNVGQFQNGNLLRKTCLSCRLDGDLVGASSCHGPVMDRHHSHACLNPESAIIFEIWISLESKDIHEPIKSTPVNR